MGTSEPTAQQITDLRRDTGDEHADTFSDDEIVRIWARVAGASDQIRQHEAAAALMIRQLMAGATKEVNQRAGAISENRSDYIKNLERLYMLYKPSLDAALGTGRQFAKRTIRGKPRQGRTEPGDFSSNNANRRLRR